MHIFIVYNDFIYEVSKYANSHPGEGICSIYLRNFNGQSVDMLFDKFHNTDEPFEHLQLSREKGYHEKIYAIGHNIFINEKKGDQKKLIRILSFTDLDYDVKSNSIPNNSYSIALHTNKNIKDRDHVSFYIRRNNILNVVNLEYVNNVYITTNQEYIKTFSKISEFINLMCDGLELYIF